MAKRSLKKVTWWRFARGPIITFGFRKLWMRSLGAVLVFCVLASLIAFVGPVSGQLQAYVAVNPSNVVGTNKLSLGFTLTTDWKYWQDRPIMNQLVKDANFKLVRLFSFLVEPCARWNEATRTGTFNWTNADLLFQRILGFGAEPLVTLGFYDSNGPDFPLGMAIDPATGLPRPSSFAAYCKEWVRHAKQTGRPIRFYEIINEPWLYFGWNNYTRLANYKAVFNSVAGAMRLEDPNVLLGFDGSNRQPVLDYWLANGGADLGFIAFHKYDAGTIGRFTDQEMTTRAETFQMKTASGYYGIDEARRIYSVARGKVIKIINSESNFNSASRTGTDPKIQQMIGAVWTALVLQTGIVEGLDYNIYYSFSSRKSWERANRPSGGVGFGMVNLDDDNPWYPYYVQELIGYNLAVGDQIVESASSSSFVRSLAWTHGGKLNMLVICKSNQTIDLKLYGLQGVLNYSRIDNTVSWEYPRLQTGTIDSTVLLTIRGYTVIFLHGGFVSPTPIFRDGFESGQFSAWSGISATLGETASISSTLLHQGTYSARFASNGNNGYESAYCYRVVSPQSELSAMGYFYASQSGIAAEGNRFYFIRIRSGSNDVAYAGWRMVGGVAKWSLIIRDGTGYATAYSNSSPKLYQWYNIQLHWVQDSTKGYGELYVDGVLLCSISSRNTATLGSANLVRFGLAEATNCHPTTVYCDDCSIMHTRI